MKGEEREVLILARRARSPRGGGNVATECEDADRLDRGSVHSRGQHTRVSTGKLFKNVPEDKSSPHIKGNDRSVQFPPRWRGSL